MGNKPSLKKKQKSFKTRHATKGSIKAANKGRIDSSDGSGHHSKHVMSKSERRNLKTQIRNTKHAQLVERTKLFDGRNGVPRNVALIPLTADIDTVEVAGEVTKALDAISEGMGIINVAKFRQRMRLFVPKFDKFFDMMDAARSADFVVFVLSANQEITDYGEQIMRCITMQGVTTSFGLIWGVSKEAKEKDIRQSLTSWFSHFFPEERLYSLNNPSEVAIVGRLICQKTPRGLHWRDDRSYLVAERAEVSGNAMIIEGQVRGKKLSPDEYMHVQGFGDYKILRIDPVAAPTDGEAAQPWESSVDRSQLINRLVNPEEAVEINSDNEDDERLEGQGVRIDGHTDVTAMIEAGVTDQGPQIAKHVPEGTSEYQRAWFLEGEDYRSDSEDEEGVLTDEEGDLIETQAGAGEEAMDAESEADDVEEMDDVMGDDFDEANFNKNATKEARDDLEFPDEIELDPRGSAKDRLKRYRGVRSIRHTDWNSREADPRAPEEFARLYRPGNLFATKNRTAKLMTEGAPLGAKVRIYLEGTPESVNIVSQEDPLSIINRGSAFTAFGLLPGEEKLGYVNATITLDSEVMDPIKSKTPIVVQYGPRRMLINPLFSQGGHSDNDVYKYNRYLHPGRSAVATFIAPVLLTNAPVVFYRTEFANEQIVLGAGTVQDSDSDRVIVKTAILTGLPVKIHRKLVTIRHMFFSRDDVEWFKSVPLFTKLGAQGFIKESLGTHGLFKATFDKKIKSEDTIALPLYKRVWPKLAQPASM